MTAYLLCCAPDADSIFAPRRKEAESRNFWDTDRVVRKALDSDFGRMLKEDRIVKLMAKSDIAVVNGQKTVSESLEEVRTPSLSTCYYGDGRRAVENEGCPTRSRFHAQPFL